ncbi:membrane peptidoglycan carboxypeptidase [Lachnotalea glycerini]|uniref:Penicillin-binding protein 1A n=1 Tax=Lachnotalea glycerini TaxID=1763509 RepID=A0A255ILN8_9FIRM|nr:transglycosylase domain-containing protein [Lachnotalea glycerini]PXV93265.1 membrane peptidoglycan carboxypeptidase [Lachnotalea glycerini]RDY31915.1 penicillin-binding protein [Lachnotalea glycerini]
MKKKYIRAFRRGFIIGTFLILLFILVPFIMLFPKYQKYTAEAKEKIEAMGDEAFYSSLTGYIYDDEGNVIKKIKNDKDTNYLSYDEIPEDVVNAFIAIEDRTFWTNSGVDLKGIIRVAYNYVKSRGEEMHGASTITQQLVRKVYISSEVTIERKLKEMCYALELNKRYSKKQIMEYYVNNIYYANGFYGIEAAAKGYFNKSASELTISQKAYLCAIPNSPTYYDPIKNPENALARRDKILNDMKELNYITKSEYNEAVSEEIVLNTSAKSIDTNPYGASYAMDCVTRYFMEKNGFEFQYVFNTMEDYEAYLEKYNESFEEARNEWYKSGYQIYTSLNTQKQEQLQESIDSALSFSEEVSDDGIYNLQSSATCIDNETNKVIAIVGGRSQDITTYLNRAYQSYRQPGSSIKPLIIYTPALEMGYNPDSTILNLDIDTWKASKTTTGTPIVLREAVERSINGAAWGLMLEITPKKALSYLQNMDFSKIVPNDYYESASLGGLTYGVSTVEMASAYNSLVNHGTYTQPTCIISIIDKDGNEVYEDKQDTIQAYTENAANGMIDILKGVVTNGTAKSAGWSSKTQAAGKTGTTNDNKDGWFCGVTPYYTISVWVGYDNPKALTGLSGASYPLKIWNKAMSQYVLDLPAKSFDGNFVANEEEATNFDDATDNDLSVSNSVQEIINSMYAINKEDANWPAYANSMYDNAMIKVNQITSQALRDEMAQKVDEAYSSLTN